MADDAPDLSQADGRGSSRVRLALAAAGAVLALLALAAWVPGGGHGGGAFILTPGGGMLACGAADGSAALYYARYRLGPGQPWIAQTFGGEMEAGVPLRSWLGWWTTGYRPPRGRWGFVADAGTALSGRASAAQYDSVGQRRAWAVLAVPAWALLLLAALLATPWARHKIRNYSRRRAGRCVGCGYDLRHSPTRCPECGRPSLIAGGGSPG